MVTAFEFKRNMYHYAFMNRNVFGRSQSTAIIIVFAAQIILSQARGVTSCMLSQGQLGCCIIYIPKKCTDFKCKVCRVLTNVEFYTHVTTITIKIWNIPSVQKLPSYTLAVILLLWPSNHGLASMDEICFSWNFLNGIMQCVGCVPGVFQRHFKTHLHCCVFL